MNIKKALKELWFQWSHTPNSAEGLRHRAQKLIDDGTDPNNPYVTALLKQAKLMEESK